MFFSFLLLFTSEHLRCSFSSNCVRVQRVVGRRFTSWSRISTLSRLPCVEESIPNKGVYRVDAAVALWATACTRHSVRRPRDPWLKHTVLFKPPFRFFLPFVAPACRNLMTCYNAFEHGWSTTAYHPACPRSRETPSPLDAPPRQDVAQEVSALRVFNPGEKLPHIKGRTHYASGRTHKGTLHTMRAT